MKLFDQVGNLKKKPWYKIKDTDGVINFIGKENPTPLAEDEIGKMMGMTLLVAKPHIPLHYWLFWKPTRKPRWLPRVLGAA